MREIPRYIGNRPQASLLHRDILTELRSFFSLLPKQTPMYVRNTHTHMHPAIGTFHYTSSLHASPCRLLGLLGYTIFGATTYRLVYSTALLHLHLVLLSFFPYLFNGQYLTFATHERKPGIISLKTVRESKNLSHPSLGIAALLGLPYLPSYLPPTCLGMVGNRALFPFIILYIQQQRTRFLARVLNLS